MTVKLLVEQHFEFISLKGGCTGSSESTLVKMPHCWKSRVTAHIYTGVNLRFKHMPSCTLCWRLDNMSLGAKKPVFRVSEKLRVIPVSLATMTS